MTTKRHWHSEESWRICKKWDDFDHCPGCHQAPAGEDSHTHALSVHQPAHGCHKQDKGDGAPVGHRGHGVRPPAWVCSVHTLTQRTPQVPLNTLQHVGRHMYVHHTRVAFRACNDTVILISPQSKKLQTWNHAMKENIPRTQNRLRYVLISPSMWVWPSPGQNTKGTIIVTHVSVLTPDIRF